MRNKKKIFNDPIYGLISFPYEILYDLIEHPYFQRLRRISQMGLSHFVYPGATHTRFNHALGALHLMVRSLRTLIDKGIIISEEERKATCIAILLHDIGHGPFSHALEKEILDIHHEQLSLWIMKSLNETFNGKLTMAIAIFKNEYPKKFLHQLVSSQLDMDRMDYLNRDSFYSGVAEGVVGSDRIISMLHVSKDQLVVEEKALYSVEKFLMARHLMYMQVYLHKTALAAEKMLVQCIRLIQEEEDWAGLPENLVYFLKKDKDLKNLENKTEIIQKFNKLDDHDIWITLKKSVYSTNRTIEFYANSLLDRKLFKIHLSKEPFNGDLVNETRRKLCSHFKVSEDEAAKLVLHGIESNQAYTTAQNEIQILKKTGLNVPFSALTENLINTDVMVRFFLCYPRI